MRLTFDSSLLYEESYANTPAEPDVVITVVADTDPINDIVETLCTFNGQIRTAQDKLSMIGASADSGASEVYNQFKQNLEEIDGSLQSTDSKIQNLLTRTIEKFNFYKPDRTEESYSLIEREDMLNVALERADISETQVSIYDIQPTSKLLQGSYPDIGVMESIQWTHATRFCRLHTVGLHECDSSPEKLIVDIAKDNRRLVDDSLGKNHCCDTNAGTLQNALMTAEANFGKRDKVNVNLTAGLYSLAMDNLAQQTRIKNFIANRQEHYSTVFNSFRRNLTSVEDAIVRALKSMSFVGVKEDAEQVESTPSNIASMVRSLLDNLSKTIDSNLILFVYKIARFQDVLQSSLVVRDKCHFLIQKYTQAQRCLDVKDPACVEVDEVKECDNSLATLNVAFDILNDSYSELYAQSRIYRIIHEEEEAKKEEEKKEKKKDKDEDEDKDKKGFFASIWEWIKKQWDAFVKWWKKLWGLDDDKGSKTKEAVAANKEFFFLHKDDVVKDDGKKWKDKDIPDEALPQITGCFGKVFKLDNMKKDIFIEFAPGNQAWQNQMMNTSGDDISDQKYGSGSNMAISNAVLKKVDSNAGAADSISKFKELLNGLYWIPGNENLTFPKFSESPLFSNNANGGIELGLKKFMEFLEAGFNSAGFMGGTGWDTNPLQKGIDDVIKGMSTNKYEEWGKAFANPKEVKEEPAKPAEVETKESANFETDSFMLNLSEEFGLSRRRAFFLREADEKKEESTKETEEDKKKKAAAAEAAAKAVTSDNNRAANDTLDLMIRGWANTMMQGLVIKSASVYNAWITYIKLYRLIVDFIRNDKNMVSPQNRHIFYFRSIKGNTFDDINKELGPEAFNDVKDCINECQKIYDMMQKDDKLKTKLNGSKFKDINEVLTTILKNKTITDEQKAFIEEFIEWISNDSAIANAWDELQKKDGKDTSSDKSPVQPEAKIDTQPATLVLNNTTDLYKALNLNTDAENISASNQQVRDWLKTYINTLKKNKTKKSIQNIIQKLQSKPDQLNQKQLNFIYQSVLKYSQVGQRASASPTPPQVTHNQPSDEDEANQREANYQKALQMTPVQLKATYGAQRNGAKITFIGKENSPEWTKFMSDLPHKGDKNGDNIIVKFS